MRIWRITKAKYVSTAFSGFGAEMEGGRWNHTRTKMVYASSTLSLASLELFVHVEPLLIPDDLHAVRATIPGNVSVEKVEIAKLPGDWQNYPGPTSLKDFGTKWLDELRSFVLIVPSAVNPEEQNILLNPNHPEMGKVTDIQSQPFKFDPRMWK